MDLSGGKRNSRSRVRLSLKCGDGYRNEMGVVETLVHLNKEQECHSPQGRIRRSVQSSSPSDEQREG